MNLDGVQGSDNPWMAVGAPKKPPVRLWRTPVNDQSVLLKSLFKQIQNNPKNEGDDDSFQNSPLVVVRRRQPWTYTPIVAEDYYSMNF